MFIRFRNLFYNNSGEVVHLRHHFNCFSETLVAISDEEDEGYHQDIKAMDDCRQKSENKGLFRLEIGSTSSSCLRDNSKWGAINPTPCLFSKSYSDSNL